MANSHTPPHPTEVAAYPQVNYGSGAKWIKSLTQDRLNTFHGGHFSDVNISSKLFFQRVDDPAHVRLQVWSAPGLEKPTFEEAMQQEFRSAKKGELFGPSWTNHWFKVSLTIPSSWAKYERVQFEFDPDAEAMIFSTDGTPLQGITGGYGVDRRVEYIIPAESVRRGVHDFVIESSCNGMFGISGIGPPDNNRYFVLRSADLVVPDMDAWRLLWDFFALHQIVNTMPGNTPLQNQALLAANTIMNVFDHRAPQSMFAARAEAAKVFGADWAEKAEKVYTEGQTRASVWGIGHCHIDTAWLWPYRVTQQKVARSWSTQIDLMERYPEHRFTCSSAQQYKWLEQLYPPLFERVKAKVAEGKFHPVGGSWVENDANMPSGEALCRQFIFGQRFFESRFGIRCKTAWLPDSFGLTGALPQLIRLADMEYFFTQKLSWNNINNFPHSTFNWVGIDGTQVLCHMTPVDTYTAQATVGDVNKGVTNHKNLESSSTALLVFGNGDGGGGPIAPMLENLRRLRATANEHRDLPVVSMGASVEDFYDDIMQHTDAGKTLPNWRGELYLEFHRGTYTSHGSIKKGNRKSEILLRDVELIATLASLSAHGHHHERREASPTHYLYPKNTIDTCWEKVLLNQFHDVLPGSAIGMVYVDAEQLYAEVAHDLRDALEDGFKALLPGSAALDDSSAVKALKGGSLVAYNTTPFPRRAVVRIPFTPGLNVQTQVVQVAQDGKSGLALFDCPGEGGGLGQTRGLLADCAPVAAYSNGVDHFVLRSAAVQLTISKGRITSFIDVPLGRELIAEGETGGLVIFEDRPNNWDAWDVEIHHLEKARQLEFSNISISADGPLRATLETQVKYDQSSIKVSIHLDALTATTMAKSRPMFVFDAEVDWHQRHEFLKFELPLNINSDVATYETQFGHIQRPTHKNTTWDIAKFEVCGHKYADLSEYGYGVAILTESKYGYACTGNILRLSLLRAGTSPDEEQDQGTHSFSWAVMPHVGHFLESDVPKAAYLFNSPLHVRMMSSGRYLDAATAAAVHPPFVLRGAPNVVLETVKRGDDDVVSSSTTVVLRVYEAFGGHANADLYIADYLQAHHAAETNLLEDQDKAVSLRMEVGAEAVEGQPASSKYRKIALGFRGFEVKTIKLSIGPGHHHIHQENTQLTKRESWVAV